MSMRFYWNKQPFVSAVRSTANDALQDLKQPARSQWLEIAPVGQDRAAPKPRKDQPHAPLREGHKAGELRDSWHSWVKIAGTKAYLYFGAFTRYAIYVELGTGKMAPRAPIRKTAEVVATMMLPALVRQAARRGLKVT